MINRIDETIEMKDLPTWLQELWEHKPSLARRAEKHYLELTEQYNIADVRLSLLNKVKEIAFGDGSAQERMVDIKALFSNEA